MSSWESALWDDPIFCDGLSRAIPRRRLCCTSFNFCDTSRFDFRYVGFLFHYCRYPNSRAAYRITLALKTLNWENRRLRSWWGLTTIVYCCTNIILKWEL